MSKFNTCPILLPPFKSHYSCLNLPTSGQVSLLACPSFTTPVKVSFFLYKSQSCQSLSPPVQVTYPSPNSCLSLETPTQVSFLLCKSRSSCQSLTTPVKVSFFLYVSKSPCKSLISSVSQFFFQSLTPPVKVSFPR